MRLIASLLIIFITVIIPTPIKAKPVMVERLIFLEEPMFSGSGSIRETIEQSQTQIRTELERLSIEDKIQEYHAFWIQNVISVIGQLDVIEKLSNFSGVRAIIPNKRIFIPHENSLEKDILSKTEIGEIEWNLKMIGAPEVWMSGNEGEGATVGVLDTGCDPVHPELAGKIVNFASFDSYGRKSSQTISNDSDGHGTGVCSVIAGEKLGVAPKAKLIVGQVIPGGSGSLTQIIAGLQWIADPDDNPETNDFPKVVNMSFGSEGTMEYLSPGIKNLVSIGILPVASIGNDGEGSSSNPGNMPDVFAVGSVNYSMKSSTFSGGDQVVWENDDDSITLIKPDVCAPGEGIRVAAPHRSYDVVDGTSFASPHVVGLCALMLSEKPGLAAEDLRDSIQEHVLDLGKSGKDRRFGNGLIQSALTIEAIKPLNTRTINISWPKDSILWGDITVKTNTRIYKVSREMSSGFSFLTKLYEDVTISSFGFEDANLQADSIELKPLPVRKVTMTVTSEGNPLECRLRVQNSPLPAFDGPDGTVVMIIPDGSYSLSISAFGQSSKTVEIKVTNEVETTVEMTPALVAFIDDRRPLFGFVPQPIKSLIKPALDSTKMPYFIWQTTQGKVTSTQLEKFPYMIWNSGGALSEKETRILKGYLEAGGKLILTSPFYSASYLGQTESATFLKSYFKCDASDEGGVALTHWNGSQFKSLALGSPDGFISSSELIPLSEEAKPILSYTGSTNRKVAAIKVSKFAYQGIILGFTLPDVASSEDRSWLINSCLNSFDETRPWRAKITDKKTANPIGATITIGEEKIDFQEGDIFIPHIPTSDVQVEVSSFGYNTLYLKGTANTLPKTIALEKALQGDITVDINQPAYIIFDDRHIKPILAPKAGTVSLPYGIYKVTLASFGFSPIETEIKVPGNINARLQAMPPRALLSESGNEVSMALNLIGIPFLVNKNPMAAEVISSGLFIWSKAEDLTSADDETIKELKIALTCGAKAIIAGPELVKSFGDPVNIVSAVSPVYASIGKDSIGGILISISKSSNRYDVTIPVIGGGTELAQFIGQGSSMVQLDNLVVSAFDFKVVDLDIVLAEVLRRIIDKLQLFDARLPNPIILTPTKPSNKDTIDITGFAPPGSESSLTVDGRQTKLTLDPEGYFSNRLTLTEGRHAVVVNSKNKGRVSISDVKEISIDQTPPVISPVNPKDGKTSALEIEVLAKITSSNLVTVNGKSVQLQKMLLKTKIPATGSQILITAVDEAGNKSEKFLRYQADPEFCSDAKSSKAYFEISQLGAANVLTGEKNIFGASQNLTRKRAVVWLVGALDLKLKVGKSPFKDVPKSSSEEPYIITLVQAGLISSGENFNPDKPATKEFLIQVIFNGLKIQETLDKPAFTDVPSTNYYYTAIQTMTALGIINPKDARVFANGKFGLDGGVKREQAAVILYNLLLYRAKGE